MMFSIFSYNYQSFLFLFHFKLFIFVFCHSVSLCSPGWLWTCDPPAFIFQVTGLKAYTTIGKHLSWRQVCSVSSPIFYAHYLSCHLVVRNPDTVFYIEVRHQICDLKSFFTFFYWLCLLKNKNVYFFLLFIYAYNVWVISPHFLPPPPLSPCPPQSLAIRQKPFCP
jgi:hypothetical protein